jgi:hypothetical protein
MIRALERGLSLSDFNEMTVGMLIDFIVTYNNGKMDHEEEEERFATQNDFDCF